MRKISAAFIAVCIFVLALTGCSGNAGNITVEAPVTLQQVNTEGKYAARGYLESILSGDRELFNACYPAGFVDDLNEVAGVDVFDQYMQTIKMTGTVMGTASAGFRDYSIENGYDTAQMRARICYVTGKEYGNVGKIQIQKVRAFFQNDQENYEADFFFVVFESEGSWYMFESYRKEAEF